MKTIKNINIIEFDDGFKAVEVLHEGYNIVESTIYDNELSEKILELLAEA